MIQFPTRHVVPRIQIVRVRRGAEGTLSTAKIIGQLIRAGAKDFYVRQKAIEVFRTYRVPPPLLTQHTVGTSRNTRFQRC